MREFFGVNKRGKVALPGEHHTGSHNRPGQWPSADFIQPCDTGKTLAVQGTFMKKGIAQSGIICGERMKSIPCDLLFRSDREAGCGEKDNIAVDTSNKISKQITF
jgi:hypothetical protein